MNRTNRGPLGKIIVTELTLQRRSTTIRFGLSLLILILVIACLIENPAFGSTNNNAQATVAIMTTFEFWLLLIFPWLLSSIFARDRHFQFDNLLWSRPLQINTYILGKISASVIIILGITLLMFPIAYVIYCLLVHQLISLAMWLILLVYIALSNLFAVLVFIAFLLLISRPVVCSMLTNLLFMATFVLRVPAPTDPLNLTGSGVFSSPSIGFGPDMPLLIHQRIMMLSIIALLLWVVLFLGSRHYQALAPLQQNWQRLTYLGLSILPFLVIFTITVLAIPSAPSLGALPPIDRVARISHQQLALVIDPVHQSLSGTSRFDVSLSPDATSFIFVLNPSLSVQSVTLLSPIKQLSFRSVQGWTTVHLSSSQSTAPLSIQIKYAGTWQLPRSLYVAPSASFQLGSAALGATRARSMITPSVTFLEGDERSGWFPVIWSTASCAYQRDCLIFDQLQIRIPRTVTIIPSHIGTITPVNTEWQQYMITKTIRLPRAFFIALQHPTWSGQIVSEAQPPIATIQTSAELQLRQIAQLQHDFGDQDLHWSGVMTPFITAPVVGDGIVFIPEISQDMSLDFTQVGPGDPIYTHQDVLLTYRSVAAVTAAAWWYNAIEIQSNLPEYFAADFNTFGNSGSPLWALLTNYAAITITRDAYGTHWFDREISDRTAIYTNPGTRNDENNSVLALVELDKQVGIVTVQNQLTIFAQHYSTTPATIPRFIDRIGPQFASLFQPFFAINAVKEQR